jgi:hypothetical protein
VPTSPGDATFDRAHQVRDPGLAALRVIAGSKSGHGGCKALPKSGEAPKHSRSCTIVKRVGSLAGAGGSGVA